MSWRARLGIVGVVVALVMGYLMISGFGAGKVYYYTVDEFQAGRDDLAGRFVRVSGVVKPGSLDWEPARIRLRFGLASAEGGDATLPVRYERMKPDLLQESTPVIVEGRLGAGGVFRAERVLVKCPSKYEAAADGT